MPLPRPLRGLLAGAFGSPASAAGWLLLIVVVGRQALLHGTQWEFGRSGTPYSLVSAADPHRYADGAPIDPVTLALVRSGQQDEVTAGTALVIAAGLLLSGVMMWRVVRRRVRLQQRSPEVDWQRGSVPPVYDRHRRRHR